MKFRPHLLTALAGALLLASALGATFYVFDRRAEQRRLITEVMHRDDLRARQIAISFAESIEQFLDLLDVDLGDLASSYAAGTPEFASILRSMRDRLPANAFSQLVVLDATGHIVMSSDGSSIGLDLSDRPHFRIPADAAAPRLYIGDPTEWRTQPGTWGIPLSRAIRRDGRFLGIVVAVLRPEFVAQRLAATTLNADDVATLVTEGGTIIARNRQLAAVLGRKLPPDRPWLDPTRSDLATIRTRSVFEPAEYDFAWHHLGGWPLIAVVALDETAELAPLRAAQATAIWRGNLAMALLLGFAIGAAALLLWAQRQQARLAEREAEASHERLRLQTILKTAGDGIHIIDAEGRLIEANDAFLAMLGYDSSAVGKLTVHDWDSLLASDMIARVLDHLIGSRGKAVLETRHRRADGQEIEVEVTASAVEIDGKGYIYNSARDITVRKSVEASLRRSEERYHALFFDSKVAMLLIDPDDGRIVDANLAAAEFYGWDCDTLKRMRIAEINTLSPREVEDEMHLAQQQKRNHFYFRHRLHSGIVRDVEVHSGPVRMEDRALLLSVVHDITDRKLAEDAQRLAAQVFVHAREGIVITDANLRIVDVNDAFLQISGYPADELIGQDWRIISSGRQTAEFYLRMDQRLSQDDSWSGEIWNRRKNGEIFASILTVSSVRDAAGEITNYVGLCTDITPLKQHQEQLEHIAHFDALTGLPNRVLLADRLQQALLRTRRNGGLLAVVYIDLDGFKSVNDGFGHDTGDDLLAALGQRMRAALREEDTIARIGGDEFVAVMAGLQHQRDCEAGLDRLLRATSEPVPLRGQSFRLSASMGVTLYPHDASEADQLLRHADQAMYVAKQSGKNRYHMFDISRDSAAKVQRELQDRLRQAVERDEFVLHYQPKVNMLSGAVIGAEALIRWNHPDGMLPPAAFLPMIEDDALCVDVGDWVIATALAQMARWRSAGLSLRVSVNVAPRQVQMADFAARLQRHLAAYPQIDPTLLELELLESSTIEDINKVSELMHSCKAIGVRFALDDFGTGYSALTYLRRLPVDVLKIDQSFVRDMLVDRDDLAIVESVLGLAKAFQREAIAEGVESEAHGVALLGLGCHLAQGYGIARPMPAAELPGWIAAWVPPRSWLAERGAAAAPIEMFEVQPGE